eukprot:10599621-Heterocapsa_arctica.AAC.1
MTGTQPRPWETYRAAKLLREPSTVASITRKANDWAQSTDVIHAFALAEQTSYLEAAWHLLNGGVNLTFVKISVNKHKILMNNHLP